ncbi:PRC-barrel domain-containing protein [Microvirga sp. G4-2]|uniref:PRC-barrel domain-containing protein n=1 Tax=Microvirga sp. G4-2 TaxID=3434467 RepID=UPI004043F23D
MRTYYVFQAKDTPALRGFTNESRASILPAEYGPWTLVQEIGPDEEWTPDVSRAVVAAGILENGYYLSGPLKQVAPRPIIESDRVEGTAVYDRNNAQIGTIKRLIIEKVSGRVLYVDVTFGGLFGVGVHHHTIPWDKLTYDTELEGYHTDITEEQLRAAPVFSGERRGRLDKSHEQEMQQYWLNLP